MRAQQQTEQTRREPSDNSQTLGARRCSSSRVGGRDPTIFPRNARRLQASLGPSPRHRKHTKERGEKRDDGAQPPCVTMRPGVRQSAADQERALVGARRCYVVLWRVEAVCLAHSPSPPPCRLPQLLSELGRLAAEKDVAVRECERLRAASGPAAGPAAAAAGEVDALRAQLRSVVAELQKSHAALSAAEADRQRLLSESFGEHQLAIQEVGPDICAARAPAQSHASSHHSLNDVNPSPPSRCCTRSSSLSSSSSSPPGGAPLALRARRRSGCH